MIQSNLSFTFLPERCPIYQSPKFRICSFMPAPNDELATYMTLLLKGSLPDFPMNAATTKRGSAPAHLIGLQVQCANQHHHYRFCQNNNSIPCVNLGSPFSDQAKGLLLHASLSILEKEKQIFDRSLSPFYPDSTNKDYVHARVILKQNLVSYLDPTGDVIKEHDTIKVNECPDNSTLRLSKGLLGRHHDDLNRKGPDDTTISLHSPTPIDSLFNSEELLPRSHLSKQISKCGMIDGKVAPNLLLYTRKIACNYASAVRYRTEYLNADTSCRLTKLVMRLLLTCK